MKELCLIVQRHCCQSCIAVQLYWMVSVTQFLHLITSRNVWTPPVISSCNVSKPQNKKWSRCDWVFLFKCLCMSMQISCDTTSRAPSTMCLFVCPLSQMLVECITFCNTSFKQRGSVSMPVAIFVSCTWNFASFRSNQCSGYTFSSSESKHCDNI